jgi:PAS domain S-box-containing protein
MCLTQCRDRGFTGCAKEAGVTVPEARREAPEPPRAVRAGLETATLAALGQAVVVADLHGCVLLWNPAAEELFGWPADRVLGRSLVEIIASPDRLVEARAALAQTLHGATWTGDVTPRRRDGERFTAHVIVTPMWDGDHQVGVVGVLSDVSRQRGAETQLRESERMLRTLFESIDEGYALCELVVDERGTPVDYLFVEVNPLFESMTGLHDPIGRTAREVVEDLEDSWLENYGRVALGRESIRIEGGVKSLGRWFDVFAVPVDPAPRFAVVFRDQSDRHRAELALRDSEERFRTIADQLPHLVWERDAAGEFTWVNDAFRRFFGVTPEQAIRMDRAQHVHPDDRPDLEYTVVTAVRDHRPFHTELRVRRADDEWRWLEIRGLPQFDAEGRYRGHVGTSTDVTDRKAAEARLRSAAAVAAYRARLIATVRSAGDPVEVQEEAVRLLGEHLGAGRVHFGDIDETGQFGVVRADYHPGLPSVVGIYRLNDYGPAAMDVFRAGETLVIDDVAHDPRLTGPEREATASLQIGAYVMHPMVRQGRTVNVLVVHHREAHRWTDEELDVIRDTADHSWAAVEQVRADEVLRLRHARAELVAQLLSDLERQPTVAGRYQRLADALVPDFADYVTVEAPGQDDPVLAVVHRDPQLLSTLSSLRREHRVSDSDPRSASVSAAGEPQLIGVITPALRAEYSTDPTCKALLDRLAPRSHVVVPLDLGGGVDGVLMAGISDPDRAPFTREDLDFLAGTARRVGVLLSAARLRQEEHDIAVRLQQALLPDELIWHPHVPITARYHAADALLEVGGDWYDTFSWPSGHIGVMVGDVVGHNLDSAAAMGRLRAATAALAISTPPDPAALMGALEQFARGPDGIDFVTAVCVVVDPATGELSYSSAGHPPLLVVHPGAPAVQLEDALSAPLGSAFASPRISARITLRPGSLVVMYTDGLIERRRRSPTDGLVQLEQLATRLADRPLGVIADELISGMAADSPAHDDVVVACFRYTPVRARFERSLPADGRLLAGLRADVRAWMDEIALTGEYRDHVLLGVGEACTNVVEHAYVGRPAGPLDVVLADYGYHVTVEVRDQGAWRPSRSKEDGGRGTPIMQKLADRFYRRTEPGGTTVALSLSVPERREPSRP